MEAASRYTLLTLFNLLTLLALFILFKLLYNANMVAYLYSLLEEVIMLLESSIELLNKMWGDGVIPLKDFYDHHHIMDSHYF